MYPSAFEYETPADVGSAIRLLVANQGARVVAGGQRLLPRIRRGEAHPTLLVDVDRIHELREVEMRADLVILGATVREAALAAAPPVLGEFAAVSDAARQLDPLARNWATLGGGLARADALADHAPVLVALDAMLVARGPDGQRAVPATHFFTRPGDSVLHDAELLTQVRLPRVVPRAASAHVKAAGGENVACSAAAVLVVDGETVTAARVVVGRGDAVPWPAQEIDAWLEGRPATTRTFDEAGQRCAALAPTPAPGDTGRSGLVAEVVAAALSVAARRARASR